MINVKIKCFSQVKYALGKDELNLDLKTGTTSLDLENMGEIKTLIQAL